MKLLGGMLLIVGTAIGGGMLALPVAASESGFISSSLLLIGCWFIMTAGALLILEVNLWLPRNNNVISMAKVTIGKRGQILAWFVYLLLLYSLLAAYIDGGGDFLRNILLSAHLTLSSFNAHILFTILLGYIVYRGIQSVDISNRILMFGKLGSFLLLVILISPHISLPLLKYGEPKKLAHSITIAISSFGFATIIPSLRIYFHNDIKKLRFAIIVGSMIPLVCYLIWDAVIMGVIPRGGENGLIAMLTSGRSNSEMINQISAILNIHIITLTAQIFTSICLLTSFLGVGLSLSDFLADGFQLEKVGINKFIVSSAALLPPLLIVLFYPGAFIKALSYAGIYSVILLILLPALMAWIGRYRKCFDSTLFTVPGGRILLSFLIIVSILIIGQSIYSIVMNYKM